MNIDLKKNINIMLLYYFFLSGFNFQPFHLLWLVNLSPPNVPLPEIAGLNSYGLMKTQLVSLNFWPAIHWENSLVINNLYPL